MTKNKLSANLYHSVNKHLNEHIGDELKRCNTSSNQCVIMLEYTFGREVFYQIDGFINFAKEHNFSEFQLQSTLIHDIGGALNKDTLMLPRVSDYAQYSNLEKSTLNNAL